MSLNSMSSFGSTEGSNSRIAFPTPSMWSRNSDDLRNSLDPDNEISQLNGEGKDRRAARNAPDKSASSRDGIFLLGGLAAVSTGGTGVGLIAASTAGLIGASFATAGGALAGVGAICILLMLFKCLQLLVNKIKDYQINQRLPD